MQPLLVVTTLPDQATARQLARGIVERGLAACVNILAPCTSIYVWKGELEEAAEIPLLIKTSAENYAGLETYLRQQHPYEVPEIIALPIERGLPDYLAWMAEAIRAEPRS